MTNDLTVAAIGLPNSGKTTYLAALWHLLNAADKDTSFSLTKLPQKELLYLNEITDRWRFGKVQVRTLTGDIKSVTLDLQAKDGKQLRMLFPDISGEEFNGIWKSHQIEEQVHQILSSENIILFIHANKINHPRWIVEQKELAKKMGIEDDQQNASKEEPLVWEPVHSPTQVQLVGVLKSLQFDELNIGKRRLVVLFSAWDKVMNQAVTPEKFLQTRLPFLSQYLENQVNLDYKVFGVSAQGGEYDLGDLETPPIKAATLVALDNPSDRIKFYQGKVESSDLTFPLTWFIQ